MTYYDSTLKVKKNCLFCCKKLVQKDNFYIKMTWVYSLTISEKNELFFASVQCAWCNVRRKFDADRSKFKHVRFVPSKKHKKKMDQS